MQSPAQIVVKPGSVKLTYGLVERISAGLTFTQFVQAQSQNAVSAGISGTDPVLEIPSIVSEFKTLKAIVQMRAVWYMKTTLALSGIAVVNINLLKWNNVNFGALVLQQNGAPIQSMLDPNTEIDLEPVPGTLDFSSIGLRYSVDPAINFAGWAVDPVPATNQIQLYASVKVIASND